MRCVQRLFAEMTGLVEEVHSIVVDGQRRDNSADMLAALAAPTIERLTAIEAIAATIRLQLVRRS